MCKRKTRKKKKNLNDFKKWCFGTINIRSGSEKTEGAKIYAIAKELNRRNLAVCCLRWRESGAKLVTLDTGEKFEFHWSGYKKKREAGVGILIRVHPDIEINTPDVATPRLIAIDIKVHGFNLRIVNCYAPNQS